METVFDAFIWLLHDTAEYYRGRGQQETADFLDSFRTVSLNGLKKKAAKLAEDEYTLAFIGLTNAGKSALTRALLEASVAPVRNGPATSFPMEYRYDPCWKLEVNSNTPFRKKFDNADELAVYLNNNCLSLPEAEACKVTRAVVYGPMPLLKHGLVLTDTPGFAAAYEEGNAAEKVSDRLKKYVEENVSEVFFCISSENNHVKSEERDFFLKIREKCRRVIVTKWGEEDESDADIENYRKKYQNIFSPCRIDFVGARKNYGINGLKDTIIKNACMEGRKSELKEHLRECWEDVNHFGRDYVRRGIEWNPGHRLENLRILAKREGIDIVLQ